MGRPCSFQFPPIIRYFYTSFFFWSIWSRWNVFWFEVLILKLLFFKAFFPDWLHFGPNIICWIIRIFPQMTTVARACLAKARSFFWVPHLTQALGSFSAAFPGHWQGSGSEVEAASTWNSTHMGCWYYRQWFNVLCHSASPTGRFLNILSITAEREATMASACAFQRDTCWQMMDLFQNPLVIHVALFVCDWLSVVGHAGIEVKGINPCPPGVDLSLVIPRTLRWTHHTMQYFRLTEQVGRTPPQSLVSCSVFSSHSSTCPTSSHLRLFTPVTWGENDHNFRLCVSKYAGVWCDFNRLYCINLEGHSMMSIYSFQWKNEAKTYELSSLVMHSE